MDFLAKDIYAIREEIEAAKTAKVAKVPAGIQDVSARGRPKNVPEGAVRITDGKRNAWLLPGKAMPPGFHEGETK